MTRYDSIGNGYRHTRREDPRIAARTMRAIGDARTIVNVGELLREASGSKLS
jgi:hypothetical protein